MGDLYEHRDPTGEIMAWLNSNGYSTVKEWMLDSDYTLAKHVDGSDIWFDEQRNRVDPVGCIEGAMEASNSEVRAATSKLKVPVRTTNAVKEPHLRGKLGVVLVDHKFTDMQFSFMVDIGPDHGLLQCGAFEIQALNPTDPDYQEAMNTP